MLHSRIHSVIWSGSLLALGRISAKSHRQLVRVRPSTLTKKVVLWDWARLSRFSIMLFPIHTNERNNFSGKESKEPKHYAPITTLTAKRSMEKFSGVTSENENVNIISQSTLFLGSCRFAVVWTMDTSEDVNLAELVCWKTKSRNWKLIHSHQQHHRLFVAALNKSRINHVKLINYFKLDVRAGDCLNIFQRLIISAELETPLNLEVTWTSPESENLNPWQLEWFSPPELKAKSRHKSFKSLLSESRIEWMNECRSRLGFLTRSFTHPPIHVISWNITFSSLKVFGICHHFLAIFQSRWWFIASYILLIDSNITEDTLCSSSA